ncbi:hypothetical protein LshimejAT787_0407680 [Lyophyllum shimeji]|uniref:Uncharacterized protein n=1 Tax=Lyophyllum shimeji TaxID=47721 RepID=A0A9P3PK53_LYOSH|nr:hypothetical protein LshimejAT787_0407680 [Lyophyllum shimeji]
MNTNHAALAGRSLNTVSAEMDLCELLHAMRLSAAKVPESDVPDVLMQENTSCSTSDTLASSSSSLSSESTEPHGCAYLQAIRDQFDQYATVGGEYLEAIFTHREIFSSFPAAHHQCARAFSDLAYMLEQRAWRADRDADTEAVSAFRHEAWMIAATLPSASKQASTSNGFPSYVCMMPAM